MHLKELEASLKIGSKGYLSKEDIREKVLWDSGVIKSRLENVKDLKNGHVEIIKKFISSLKI